MPYWVLVLLAAAAGALFGSLSPSWRWQRPHPVRGTIGFMLPLVGMVLLVGGHLLGWDEGRQATAGMLAIVGLLIVLSTWLAPHVSAWTGWGYALGFGWWLYFLYSQYFATS